MHVPVPAMNPRRLAVCVGAALLIGGAAGSPAASGSTRPNVLPYPGTPDASPQTQIDFPAVSTAQLAAISVTGSRSGAHQGALSTMGGGRGTAFAPAKPFTAGEQVTVRATLRNGGRVSFGFAIARPVRMPVNAATTAASVGSGTVDGAA